MSPTLICDASVRPRATDPVFLMLRPERKAAEKMRQLAWDLHAEHQLTGTPLAPERLHVTLFLLCLYRQLSNALLAALDTVAASMVIQRFLLGFDRVESFRHENERPLVLRGNDDTLIGARMLHTELIAGLRGVGVWRLRPSFTPHITLLYDPRDIGIQPIEEIRWIVRDFILVCSLRGRHQHKVLARWRLSG